MRGVSVEVETRVVAMIARGDTVDQIRQQIEGGINRITVRKIRERNKDNLEIIKQQLQTIAAEDAASIKQEANQQLSDKLKRSRLAEEHIQLKYLEYLDDKITYDQYCDIVKRTAAMSVQELVSISKEMHHQSVETEKPQASAADLAALTAAIRSGDEVKITQAVFNGVGSSTPSPTV